MARDMPNSLRFDQMVPLCAMFPPAIVEMSTRSDVSSGCDAVNPDAPHCLDCVLRQPDDVHRCI